MNQAPLRQTLEEIRERTRKFEEAEGAEPDAEKYLRKIEKATEDFMAALEEGIEDRHQARNLLNHLSGPCQLLKRKVRSAGGEEFCRELLTLIDQGLQQINGQAPAGAVSRLEVMNHSVSPVESARILVAEDDPEIGEFLREVLVEEGHEAEWISEGAAALQRMEEVDFDLLLLDLGLPDADGFTVLEQLKQSGRLYLTPVIVVTGRTGLQHAVRSIEYGAEDFLSKPVEIELLHARVNSCLEKKRLREREFTQFFPRQLARDFARHPDLREMDGKHADVSVLFCDIRGFSRISERVGPDLTLRWLRAVMDALSACVLDNEGVLVDYAGDEIMAMWGAPRESEDHAVRACETALRMLSIMPELNQTWSQEIGGITGVGIGINSGQALVGNVGTSRKFKYGPLGNPVNLGSRVQGATRYLNSDILLSSETRRRLPGSWHPELLRRLCTVRVQNILEPVELYELVPASQSRWTDLRAQYEEALDHFEDGQFREAAASLGDLMMRFPDDGPSLLLMSRVVAAMLKDGADFDPVWELPGK